MRESSAVGCEPLLSAVLCHTSWGFETFPSAKLLRVGAGRAVPRRDLGSRNVHGSRIRFCADGCTVGTLLVRANFWWKVEIQNQGAAWQSMWALLTEVFQIWFRIKEETLLILVSLGHTAHGNSCWKAAGKGLGLALSADAYTAKQFLPNYSSAPSSAQWKAKPEVASIGVFAPWTEGVYFLSNVCSSVLF